MIDEFTARGFGCLTDVTVRLTPLHAFIGPNDSGKSTLLEAIRWVAEFAARVEEGKEARRHLSSRGDERTTFSVLCGDNKYTALQSDSFGWRDEVRDIGGVSRSAHGLRFIGGPSAQALLKTLSPLRMFRLRPERLRASTMLMDAQLPLDFHDEQGAGLASVLDALRDRNEDAWRSLLDETRRLFPNVRRLQLQVRPMEGGRGKTVAAEMLDGTRVPVEHLSEGFLYFLAFAALRHLDPASLLLIEEPENGLHPARIREVVRVLRDLSRSGTQVLLTTHSPLLLNELQADEITVLTRPPGGTRATRLSEVPRYRERAENDDLLPGEFWVNYCDGELEAPLLEPVDEPSP